MLTYAILVACGFLASIINTIAGGGSMLTLPLLVALGVPATVANGTNRIFLFVQSATSTTAMLKIPESKGWTSSLKTLVIILPSALLGAWLATQIEAGNLRIVMGLIIIGYVVFDITKKAYLSYTNKEKKTNTQTNTNDTQKKKHFPRIIYYSLFFLLGLYGGFMQAGIGIILMLLLHTTSNTHILSAITAKNAIITIYTAAVIGLFLWHGQIHIYYGLALAAGAIAGSIFAAHIAPKIPTTWIERFVLLLLATSGIYMLLG